MSTTQITASPQLALHLTEAAKAAAKFARHEFGPDPDRFESNGDLLRTAGQRYNAWSVRVDQVAITVIGQVLATADPKLIAEAEMDLRTPVSDRWDDGLEDWCDDDTSAALDSLASMVQQAARPLVERYCADERERLNA